MLVVGGGFMERFFTFGADGVMGGPWTRAGGGVTETFLILGAVGVTSA